MKKVYILLIGLIGIHILILSKLQFTAWPEMFSFPYMIDKGFLIYKDFHHVYQPLLTFVLLGLYKLFGFNLITLKFITYVILALIDLMIFLNIKKITGKNALSLFTLVIFVLLQPIFDGNMLWYDIGIILPLLVSIYFINLNLFLSGLFVAFAFLIKQQAVLIGLPILIYLLVVKTKFKDIKNFLLGCLSPVVVLAILLIKYNLLKDYIFWTFEFPLIHLPKIEGYPISANTRELIILTIMALTLFIGIISNFKKFTPKFYLLMSIILLMVLSAFPRFSLFHLQPALAVYVILIGYLFGLSKRVFVILLIPLVIMWKSVLSNTIKEDRFYGINEIKFSNEVKNRVGNEKVYFLGPSSIEYVLSNTIPPKPWIENYVWHFEVSGLQKKVINGWEKDPPTYIYWSKTENGKWYDLGTYQPKEIVNYIKENYQKVEVQDSVVIWKLIKI